MTMIKNRKISPLSQREGSPCNDCIIKMICTRSFVLRTACDRLQDFYYKFITPPPPPESYKREWQDQRGYDED